MSQARAASGPDRLPWLADEPPPPKKRAKTRELAGWAAAAALLVAGASYWMGAHSWRIGNSQPQPPATTTTVPLPAARIAEPAQQPQVVFEPAPEVTPPPQREVPMARPRVEKRAIEQSTAKPTVPEEKAPTETPPAPVVATQPAPPAAASVDKPLTAWPAWQSAGAYGRIVRIGAFGTRQQAKLGWRFMVRAYPAVAHLQATVVEVRNSRGRHFYRFQIGTTSQAHSEVLCQRMEKIRLSCAVVGLPWKPKGVER
jgi:outer membrane biosynthesis protein TonB